MCIMFAFVMLSAHLQRLLHVMSYLLFVIRDPSFVFQMNVYQLREI